MRPLFLLLFCFCIQVAIAQQNPWVDSINHPYVFKNTVDYFFEEPDLLDTYFINHQNQQFRLKLDPEIVKAYNAWLENEDWLWEVVLQKLESGTLTAYNSDTGQALQLVDLMDKLVKVDTVLSPLSDPFDEGAYQAVTIYPDIMGWRLHLNWAWNERQLKLESELYAIAPIFREYDDNGENERRNTPIFLRAVTTLDSEDNPINDQQWAWAGQGSTITSWKNNEMQKGGSSTHFVAAIFYQQALIEKTIPLYNADFGWSSDQQLTPEAIGRILCQTDTLYLTDTTTFDTEASYTTYCIKPEELQFSKLNYRLYFNPAKGVLGYQPLSLEIVKERYEDEIDVSYHCPLYLLRFD
jgi:hypothetical protein